LAKRKVVQKRSLAAIRGFYKAVKAQTSHYDAKEVARLMEQIDRKRVKSVSDSVANYIRINVPLLLERKSKLADYRTNPYVLLATAQMRELTDAERFASFLFNNKLYMAMETSFGKSIESVLVGGYPLPSRSTKWVNPPEKEAEFKTYAGLTNEEKAGRRTASTWREIDRSCTVGNRRFLASIKSGPNCINDSQVDAMESAIKNNHARWLEQTRRTYPGVECLDVVIGITYGTDRTTNNKENQILVKLGRHGFIEEDRQNRPGVMIDKATGRVRVYRRIGRDFWSFIGNPGEPDTAKFVFLEILLALSRGLSNGLKKIEGETFEAQINVKLAELTLALGKLMFPKNSLPTWIRDEVSPEEMVWMATAMTAFFDEGI
jgi:hypothetical protein